MAPRLLLRSLVVGQFTGTVVVWATLAWCCAHADVCDLGGARRVIWHCSGCGWGEGPGAKLDAA